MSHQNVPPRRPRDDGRWDARSAHDGYPYLRHAPAHPADEYAAGDLSASYYPPGFQPHNHESQIPYGRGWSRPDHRVRTEPPADGPAWTESYTRRGGYGVLTDVDDDGDGVRVGRRRALVALAGAAAMVAGGATIGVTPQGRGVAGRLFGGGNDGGTAAALTDGTADRPGGQQPSSVRTYTEQNESYMGSRAGEALKRNIPSTGRLFSGPAAAAAQTRVTVKTVLAKDPVHHLARRATFGTTPKVLADITRMGIDGWIRWQLDPEKIPPTKAELKLAELPTLTLSIAQLRQQRDAFGQRGISADREMIQATIARQIWSERQLFEVMVDFWNDLLHVGPFFDGSDVQRASFDRDVVRRYALDNYADMLVSANRHPALLTYLDQSQSGKEAVNENLARENLELYSVGVDGGYKEADVRQAALLQTGRGVEDDQYVYRPERHYVGPVKILGFSTRNGSPEGGERAGEAYFRYLALHPSTARYVAQNLATRFVSDTPPRALIDRLAKTYTANKSSIKPVLMTLFSSSEFWASVGQKVRRPMEYLVATYRVLGVSPQASPGYRGGGDRTPFAEGLAQIQAKLEELGHFPTGMPTPNGYPDAYVAWTSIGTMVNGWNEAGELVGATRKVFTYVEPERLVGAPPATAGGYLDALARRLVHQPLTARERSLLLGVAGVPATAKVDATFNGAITAVARALLASPQHHLR